MADDQGSDEHKKPPSSEDVKKWQEEEAKRRESAKSRGSWKDTEGTRDAVARPRSGVATPSAMPPGWSTHGTLPQTQH